MFCGVEEEEGKRLAWLVPGGCACAFQSHLKRHAGTVEHALHTCTKDARGVRRGVLLRGDLPSKTPEPLRSSVAFFVAFACLQAVCSSSRSRCQAQALSPELHQDEVHHPDCLAQGLQGTGSCSFWPQAHPIRGRLPWLPERERSFFSQGHERYELSL